MSHEFNAVFSAPMVFNLAHILFKISNTLEPLGFYHVPYVEFADFDELKDEVQRLSFIDFMNGEGSHWSGCCIQFSENCFPLELILDKRRQDFLNIYVATSSGIVMHNDKGKLPLYLNALLEIANVTQSVIVAGDYEFFQEMVSPDELLNIILNNPDNSGFPTSLGIIKASAMQKEKIESLFSNSFRIIERAGYWLLIEHDWEQLVRESR